MAHAYGHWQEALIPHREALSSGLLEHPHNMAGGFPKHERSQTEQGEDHNILCVLISKFSHLRGEELEPPFGTGVSEKTKTKLWAYFKTTIRMLFMILHSFLSEP